MSDNEKSLGDQNTFDGGDGQFDPHSLGDEGTFAGGGGYAPQSLGDEMTFGGGANDADDSFDDGMEVVDLEARYKIEGTLGKGGMGEVLLATDTRLERKVAIKRILGTAARSKTAVSRFLTEAKHVAALNHPNIVQIYDYGRAKDGPFLIMEYVEGESLLDKCRQGPLELEEAVNLTCQLCEGLAKAHAANIIHRDIKPANVLMTPDGVPKLTDFGLAKDDTADTGMTMAGAVLGTLDFMPPEQRKDAALTDNRSDLWSLAATLYQMVTGESPRVIDLDEVPQKLRKYISQALKSKKEDRYQTAIELRDALRSSLQAPEPITQAAIDLGAGECPGCNARNDASRKFCNACGGSLRLTCLGCDAEIPVWEKFCGECGGNQQQLLDSRLEEIEKQKVEAEDLRGHHKYEAALVIAQEISAIEDERLSLHRTWSEQFAESTEAEWKREKVSANQHFTEAKKHRDVFDYESAIHAIESIPASMRSSEINGYLSSLTTDRDESVGLIRTIRESISSRKLDGLLSKVERALKLRGDREDLIKLRTQLLNRQAKQIQRRDQAFSKSKILLDQGQAKAAASLIDNVHENLLNSTQEDFKAKVGKIIHAENELSALVKEAKADGVIDAGEVAQLIPVVANYLAMNPKHEGVQALSRDLLSRLASLPPSVLSNLPPSVLSRLPPSYLSNLTPSILSKLPSSVIGEIPPITNSIGMQLKRIPIHKDSFAIGNGDATHQLTMTQQFLIGVHAVTQGEYVHVMGNLSSSEVSQKPVENVNWADSMEFCRRLSALPGELKAERVYSLPTEDEWEYACLAGTATAFGSKTRQKYGFGNDESDLGKYAWYANNSGGQIHPVGEKIPNAWGLYDMHGNVWEWCDDWWCEMRTSPPKGRFKVGRGGCYLREAEQCTAHSRRKFDPEKRSKGIGFRVACVTASQ